MFKRKIIAQNITNLTDARYFAAWGVEYLSFNIIPESPYLLPLEKIEEIKNWVEGPQTLLEANALEFLPIADGHILSNIYSSLPLNKIAFFRIEMIELQKGIPPGNYIVALTTADVVTFNSIDPSKYEDCNVFLDISAYDFSQLDNLPKGNGLVVQGGEEEQTGVKSYDELDVLYEWLLEEV